MRKNELLIWLSHTSFSAPYEIMTETYPTPEFPQALNYLKIDASYIVKGEKKISSLVRYPTKEDSTDIISTWMDWWEKTPWAINPSGSKPHWNSASRRGQIWTLFGEAVQFSSGKPLVFCLNCGSALQHPTLQAIGTTHLINHTKTRACIATIEAVHKAPGLTTRLAQSRNQTGKTADVAPLYSARALGKELVQVVVDNNLSFRTVERPSFQRFIHFLRPEAPVPTRYKFQNIFQDEVSFAKNSQLNDLSPTTRISIALDAWTANNHLSFLAIKGYYINNNWQLQEKLLDFIPKRGRPTGASMATDVLQVLSRTNHQKQLLAVTCDNAGSNTTLTRILQQQLQEEGIQWSSAENTIPCLAHVINLVVQDIIRHLKLAPSDDEETAETVQRHDLDMVQGCISVPTSLRKVCKVLSQLFITD
jgi:hypothetical protein